MNYEQLVYTWYKKWMEGDFLNLPITEEFINISPFGSISGKHEYLELVEGNKDKYLGYHFKTQDEIYKTDKACVRYTEIQDDFSLDISEWYFFKSNAIAKVVAYYHIGAIRDDRKLSPLT